MGGRCCKCCKGEEEEGMKDINRSRSCTDVLCLVIFLVFIASLVILAIVGAVSGNAESLFYGTDSTGNTCGSPNLNVAEADRVDMTKKKRIVYPRLTEDMVLAAASGSTDPASISFFGICVETCPTVDDWVCTTAGDALGATNTRLDECSAAAGGGAFLSLQSFSSSYSDCSRLMQECFKISFPTSDILFRCMFTYNTTTYTPAGKALRCIEPAGIAATSDRCVKTSRESSTIFEEPARADLVAEQLATWTAIITQLIADCANSWSVIVGIGVGAALVCGFIWITLLRYCAKCFVWFVIVLFFIAQLIFCLYAFGKAGYISLSVISETAGTDVQSFVDHGNSTDQEKTLWAGIGFVFAGLLIIYACVILFLRRQVKVAAAIISEASKAVTAMPTIVAFPITTVAAIIVVFAFWAWIFGNIYTTGSIQTSDLVDASSSVASTVSGQSVNISSTVKEYQSSSVKDWLLAYLVFAILWLNAFINGVATVAICGAFAAWYWTEVEPGTSRKQMKERFPIAHALWRTVRYHLGTIAFASLIVAIVQFLRICLEYIDKKTKDLQGKNIVVRILMKITKCCLWCFEKCVKFVTRKAYIVVAINGSPFCTSTLTVFRLIISHHGQISIVTMISGFMMMLGKMLIVAACVVLGFVCFENLPQFKAGGTPGPLSSTILPIVLVGFVAYFVATGFLTIYDKGIDTILISYLIDLKENKPGTYMFSESLAAAAGLAGKTRGQNKELIADNSDQTSSKYVVEDSPSKPGTLSGDMGGEGEFI